MKRLIPRCDVREMTAAMALLGAFFLASCQRESKSEKYLKILQTELKAASEEVRHVEDQLGIKPQGGKGGGHEAKGGGGHGAKPEHGGGQGAKPEHGGGGGHEAKDGGGGHGAKPAHGDAEGHTEKKLTKNELEIKLFGLKRHEAEIELKIQKVNRMIAGEKGIEMEEAEEPEVEVFIDKKKVEERDVAEYREKQLERARNQSK